MSGPDDSGPDEHPTDPIPSPDSSESPSGPYFDDTRPLPPMDPAEQPHYEYAVQDLTEQHVDKPRRHTGLYAAIALVLVVVAVAAVVFLMNRNDGGDRTAYCDKLRSVTGSGDLADAVGSADPGDLDELARLAPDPVAKPWADLVKLRDALQGGGLPTGINVAEISNDVLTIVDDAKSQCGITMNLPVGGLTSSS